MCWKRAGAAIGSAVLLGAAVVALTVTGRDLPVPPLIHPSRMPAWARHLGPATAGLSLVRVLGLALTAWLAAAVSSWALAWVRPRRWTAGTARLLTTAGLRAALAAALAPVPAAAAPATPVAADATGPTWAGGQATISAWPPPAPPADRSPTAPLGPEAAPAAGRWVVEAGESFWSIAAKAVTARSGHLEPTGVVAAYWTALVAANRGRLVVPGDPDLIFPGQILVLPE